MFSTKFSRLIAAIFWDPVVTDLRKLKKELNSAFLVVTGFLD